MFISYKISKKSINKLRKKGLSQDASKELETIEDKFFDSADLFILKLSKLKNYKEFKENEEKILKSAKGYFRLDKFIPNKPIREWVEAIIFALIVAGIVRTYFFAPFQIPSGSMIPTIQIGDHIFASMFSFGSPVPLTDKKLFIKPVKRRDIVIFPYPKDPDIDYIKRVIGLSGETIEIKEDKVYINDKLLEEPYAYFDEEQSKILGLSSNNKPFPLSNFGPVKIPEGKLFVMGDNRYNSADSRYWGYVEEKKITGKGQMIYWSHDPRENIFEGYKFERILKFLK